MSQQSALVPSNRFNLAPMSALIWVLTIIAFIIPMFTVCFVFWVPNEYKLIPFFLTAFQGLIYASIWLFFRPLHFDIDDKFLKIVWPLREKSFERSTIKSIEYVSGRDFRNKYGYGARVGAGGIWGAFGLYVTSQQRYALYISRTDWVVVIQLMSGKPLIITPENPEKFLALLRPQNT